MEKINKFIGKHRTTILRVIAVLILLILVLFVVKFISMAAKKPRDPEVSTSFFIKNKDEKYAMFNENGKQLTDFIYDSVEELYNGVAKVKDKDGKVAIINEKGKYVVKPGKYNSIMQNGGLFRVEEKENTYSLLNSKGKKLIKSSNFDIKSNSYLYSATIVLNKDKYVVYTYNGKKVYSFKVKKTENEEEQIAPTSSDYKEYVSVFYDGLTIIFNSRTGKIISKIKEDEQYCINNASEDGKTIALNSCVTWYEASENVKYKILENGKLKSKDGECDAISLNNDNIICTKNEVSHLLDKKWKILNTDLSMMSYKDTKNYAVKVGNDVQILRKGKTIKTIENAILSDKGYTENGIYLIYKDKEYTFINYKGKELFGRKFNKAITFDSNNLARVSEDGENYYFINTDGKKVGDFLDASYQVKDYYIVTKDNKKGVADKKGKTIVDVINDNVEIKTNGEDFYAFIKKGDDYKLISLNNKKEVLSFNTTPSFLDYYIRVENEGKITYYTYSGKKLYEE